jgi:hypothetical protein
MEYIYDVKLSDFPFKFFVLNVGPNTTVRMTRFKYINTYLHDIEPISFAPVCKPKTFKSPVYKFNTFKFDLDDEEPEIDWDSTEEFPRMINWETELL